MQLTSLRRPLFIGLALLLLAGTIVAGSAFAVADTKSDHGEIGVVNLPGTQVVVRWYRHGNEEGYVALGIFKDFNDEKAVVFLDRRHWTEFAEAYKRAISRWTYASGVTECLGTITGYNGDDPANISVYLGKLSSGATVVEIRVQERQNEPVVATLYFNNCDQVTRVISLLNDHFGW